jgi:hypothetical protein
VGKWIGTLFQIIEVKTFTFILVIFSLITGGIANSIFHGSSSNQNDSITPTSTVMPFEPVNSTNITDMDLPVYTFPSWMSDPSTNILVAHTLNEFKNNNGITFYDAATQEKFEIGIPENTKGYFWYDNAHFGFLADDLKTMQLVDLNSGQTIEEPIPPETLRLWNYNREIHPYTDKNIMAFELIHTDLNNGGLLFQQTKYKRNISKDGAFFASVNGENRNMIAATDIETTQTAWEYIAPNGYFVTNFAWSPTDENQLVFVLGMKDQNNEINLLSTRLFIVDVFHKKILRTYEGDFGEIEWSTDGKMILFTNSKLLFRNFGLGFTEAPCFYYIETGIKRCLRNIPQVSHPGYDFKTTAVYQWGPGGENIFFTYLFLMHEMPFSWSGNLCIYNLNDGQIHCPTQGLTELRENSIVGYSISPDQKYIHFCFSDSSVLNDYEGTSRDAIIKIDGTGFFSWIGNRLVETPSSCSQGSLWRPMP